jgi:hypothetical protein
MQAAMIALSDLSWPDNTPMLNMAAKHRRTVAAAVSSAVEEAVRRDERQKWAKEFRADAETRAPGGKGLPNDCDVADALLGWADVMDPR